MSKYFYSPGEIDIKYPSCTTCIKYKDSVCEVYKKDIPKEIRYEYKNCNYYKKLNKIF